MIGHEHLSEDALLDAVYGIAGNDTETHLRGCADCAQRLHAWQEKRAATAASVDIPSEFLAAQRGGPAADPATVIGKGHGDEHLGPAQQPLQHAHRVAQQRRVGRRAQGRSHRGGIDADGTA